MDCVYLIPSLAVPSQRYTGLTTTLDERLQAHNAGASPHTSSYRSWKSVMHLCFQDERREALEFERYLSPLSYHCQRVHGRKCQWGHG